MSKNFRKITTIEYSRHGRSRDYGLLCVKSDLAQEFPIHQHDFYEIEVIVRGEVKNYVDGVPQDLSAGDFYCLSPTTVHKVEKKSDDLMIYNISVFLPSVSDDIKRIINALPFPCRGHIDKATLERISVIYEILFENIKNKSQNEKQKVGALALYILTELSENVAGKYTSARESNTNLHIQNAMLYTQRNFSSDIRLAHVARYVGVTECYLSSIFSSVVGSTYKEYLSLVRIQHAKNLLITSDLPVTDIAFRCGFGSFSNFERVFKKSCGITPKEYRNKK